LAQGHRAQPELHFRQELTMNSIRAFSLALALVLAAAPAWAQQADPHAGHHPAMAAGDAAAAPAATPTPAEPDPAIARMDVQLKAMADMHAKMSAARTPAERKALMPGQMKLMQDGMDMVNAMHAGGMGAMHGGGMGAMHAGMDPAMHAGMQAGAKGGMQCPMMGGMAAQHQMMQKHMALMQAMMQAMTDRFAAGN
jgi:hypothetical protein